MAINVSANFSKSGHRIFVTFAYLNFLGLLMIENVKSSGKKIMSVLTICLSHVGISFATLPAQAMRESCVSLREFATSEILQKDWK